MLGRPALLLAVLIDDEERCAGRKNVQVLRNSITDPALAAVNALKAILSQLRVVVIDGAVHASGDELGATRRPEFVTAIRDLHRRIPSERQIHPREPEAIDGQSVLPTAPGPLLRCFSSHRGVRLCRTDDA